MKRGSAMRLERGFSTLGMLFWLAILAVAAIYGFKVLPVLNTSWKVQDMFEAVSQKMTDVSEDEIRNRLPELLRIKYISDGDLPQEFFNTLHIVSAGGKVDISSSYHVRVWLLGEPEAEPDENGEYDAEKLRGMDRVRFRLKQDFDFEPHATTP